MKFEIIIKNYYIITIINYYYYYIFYLFYSPPKKTAESYAKLLTPSYSLERKPPENYHITVLDDPTLITGKHKTIIALPYFMVK